MEPITVLYLIDDLCGMAGAERVLINMLSHTPPGQFRCLVGTLRGDPNPDIVRRLSCPVYVFPLRRTYDLGALRIALDLRRLIRREKVRIVHTIFETSDLWGSVVAKLSGCPIVVSSRRDMGFNQSPKHRLAYRVLRPVFDQVQAVSDQVRNVCIEKEGFAADRVVTLYNGVDMEKVTATNGVAVLQRTLGIEHASHVITTVGNIRWIKGTDLAVQVAAKICAQYPKAVFLIPGKVLEPEYFDQVSATARALGISDNIKFLGSSDSVFSLLKISDVFCLLSRSEGFSNALLEAMACSLPCVVTDVGGNREAIEDGESGFLVPNEDVTTAADRILALLENPVQARQMGQRGRQIVEQKFTVGVMVQRLTGYYDALLHRSH
jgi:glycosyltransferase involved in cell wall biosynthesis